LEGLPFFMMQFREFPELAKKIERGLRLDPEDALRLMRAKNFPELGALATRIREKLHGKKIYWTHSMNVNYTNLCVHTCRFCAFSKKKGEPDAYALTLDQIEEAVADAASAGIWEVHIVGGLHADFSLAYYEEMLRRIKRRFPGILIQAFTAVELDFFSKTEHLSLDDVIRRLKDAGLDAVPGGGAEIFSERPRKILCEQKISGERWLEVHERVHAAGLRSNATLLYGHLETIEERVDHLVRLRNAQDRTKGFLAFVPLAFQPDCTEFSSLPRSAGATDLRLLAVSRLFLDNFPHIRQLWNYVDEKMLQVSAAFGVDDFGGTNFDERIAKAAGSNERGYSRKELEALIGRLGYLSTPVDSLYRGHSSLRSRQ